MVEGDLQSEGNGHNSALIYIMGTIIVMRVVVITRIAFSSLFSKIRILYYVRLMTVGVMREDVGGVAVILETRKSERRKESQRLAKGRLKNSLCMNFLAINV